MICLAVDIYQNDEVSLEWTSTCVEFRVTTTSISILAVIVIENFEKFVWFVWLSIYSIDEDSREETKNLAKQTGVIVAVIKTN